MKNNGGFRAVADDGGRPGGEEYEDDADDEAQPLPLNGRGGGRPRQSPGGKRLTPGTPFCPSPPFCPTKQKQTRPIPPLRVDCDWCRKRNPQPVRFHVNHFALGTGDSHRARGGGINKRQENGLPPNSMSIAINPMQPNGFFKKNFEHEEKTLEAKWKHGASR